MNTTYKQPLILGAALLTCLSLPCLAAENPFLVKPLTQGYMLDKNSTDYIKASGLKPDTATASPTTKLDVKKTDGGCGNGACQAKLKKSTLNK